MPAVTARFDLGWDFRGQRMYMRTYWQGNVIDLSDHLQVEAAFLGKISDANGWFQRWRAMMTITAAVSLFSFQITSPQRYAVRDETLFWQGATGFIVTGGQAWHATCRVNWYSASSNPTSHWTQISPVPEFGVVIGVDLATYLAAVESWANLFQAGFVDALGNHWAGALRSSDDTYSPVVGHAVHVLSGRQKTRRRRL